LHFDNPLIKKATVQLMVYCSVGLNPQCNYYMKYLHCMQLQLVIRESLVSYGNIVIRSKWGQGYNMII